MGHFSYLIQFLLNCRYSLLTNISELGFAKRGARLPLTPLGSKRPLFICHRYKDSTHITHRDTNTAPTPHYKDTNTPTHCNHTPHPQGHQRRSAPVYTPVRPHSNHMCELHILDAYRSHNTTLTIFVYLHSTPVSHV